MSDGTAASQLSDWPWHDMARQATMTFDFSSRSFDRSACDEQQDFEFVVQQARLEWQQVFVANVAVTTLAIGWPLASRPAARAATRAKSGGFTPFFVAQARRWASVWQQQVRQQRSAESQPQAHVAQGYSSLVLDVLRIAGNGIPAATTT